MATSYMDDFLRLLSVLGPDSAEAAPRRGGGYAAPVMQQPMAATLQQPAVATPMQEQELAYKKAQAEAEQNKITEAQKKEANMKAFVTNLAAMGNGGQSGAPLTNANQSYDLTGGSSGAGNYAAYNVPEDQQGQFGEKYLTNQVLPTEGAPVQQPNVGALLTPPDNVDWQRMVAADYNPQYSVSAPGPKAPEMNADDKELQKVDLAIQSGVMPPKEGFALRNDIMKRIDDKNKEDKMSGKDFVVINTPDGQALLNKTDGTMKNLGVPNKLSESVSKKIEDQASLLAYLKRMKENYELVGKSASGPIQSRLGWVQERGVGKKLSSAEIALRRDVADFQDRILRERSGAAINEGEAARIREFTPDLSMADDVFKQRVDDVIKATEDIYNRTLKQATSRGMLLDKKEEAPAPGGGLSPQEQSELDQLRARFKK